MTRPPCVSVAAHAGHLACPMEVAVRWESGDRGPLDRKASVLPGTAYAVGWTERQARMQKAYAAGGAGTGAPAGAILQAIKPVN